MEIAQRNGPARQFTDGHEQPHQDGDAGNGGAPGDARRNLANRLAQDLRPPGLRLARAAVRQPAR
ncbi:hypothetical protein D3C86_1751190 [compost metagenome]